MINRKLTQIKTSFAATVAAVALSAQAHMQPMSMQADRLTKLDEALVASLVLSEMPKPVAVLPQAPLPVVTVAPAPVARVDLTVRKPRVTPRQLRAALPRSVVRLEAPLAVVLSATIVADKETAREVVAEYLPAGVALPPRQIRGQSGAQVATTYRRTGRRTQPAPVRRLALPAPIALRALPYYPELEVAAPSLAEQLTAPYTELTNLYFAGWRAWTSMFVRA